MSLHLSSAVVNALITALGAELDGGYMRFYAGARPATVDTALGASNTLLTEVRFADPAFAAADAGLIIAEEMEPVVGLDTGNISFFRTFKADGTTAVVDGDAALSNADCTVAPTLAITPGVPFTVVYVGWRFLGAVA